MVIFDEYAKKLMNIEIHKILKKYKNIRQIDKIKS